MALPDADKIDGLVRRIDELRRLLGETKLSATATIHRIRNRLQVLELRLYSIRKGLGDPDSTGPHKG